MKKFLLVLLIVGLAVGILAACAPGKEFDLSKISDYTKAVPTWAIIVGAVVLFLIGFGIIWKLVPGFIKVIALIALIVVIVGVAYGVWNIPLVKSGLDEADKLIHPQVTSMVSPSQTK